ncbi:hypothetical protein ACF07S_29200 [Streptomyces sp. NPDC016640]|uniref:hypothetical protein n=1 Tax=Streptomyces sp. NPDC016640 TaxID=3364969 RepID=UPI0036FCEC8E
MSDDQWHFNTGHGYDRDRVGPDGTTNDLRTANVLVKARWTLRAMNRSGSGDGPRSRLQ